MAPGPKESIDAMVHLVSKLNQEKDPKDLHGNTDFPDKGNSKIPTLGFLGYK